MRLGSYVTVKNTNNSELFRYWNKLIRQKQFTVPQIEKTEVYQIVGINECKLLNMEQYYVSDGVSVFCVMSKSLICLLGHLNATTELSSILDDNQ